MCGIAAILESSSDQAGVRKKLERIAQLQRHRGPDFQDILVESVACQGTLGLGHQRLSILDLTPDGNQPMVSACGRYVLIFNGEIYNYKELQIELQSFGPLLSPSTGDTAVVLTALARWGTSAFNRFNGMWALVFYDRQKQELLISRDRFGVKPLYWYHPSETWIMASEVKAILETAGRRFRLNRSTLQRFFIQGVPNSQEETFFEDIHEFPPASFLVIPLKRPFEGKPYFQRYWYHPFESKEGRIPVSQTAEAIQALFLDSVRIRLRSDVPVGVLLSGGIDSSSILAAAKKCASLDSITALSIVSSHSETNEEYYVDEVSRFLDCQVRKIKIDLNPLEMLDQLPEVCWLNDQPIGGLTAVAHKQLMSAAHQLGITVLLSGQGADEQLAGYNKYFYFYLMKCLRNLSWGEGLSMILGCLKNGTIFPEFSFREAKRYIPGLQIERGSYLNDHYFYGQTLAPLKFTNSYAEREWLDLTQFSIPWLLHYEDRMSMAMSKEIRVPFLDYRLVEAFARLPVHQKLRKGWTKYILRQAMKGLLPETITWRKDKKGFTMPEAKWIRHEFRGEFQHLFDHPMAACELGAIDQKKLQKSYARFVKGDIAINYKEIFSAYCFEIWLQRFHSYIDFECQESSRSPAVLQPEWSRV